MTDWTEFIAKLALERELKCAADGQVRLYSEVAAEHAALAAGPAIVNRSHRAILDVCGADRATWLHNLTTNVVKTLAPGDGNYAFATNVQGRILFDLNVIVRPDSIRLDMDRRFLDGARAHLDKHIIMEDVTLQDRSNDPVVIGVAGDRAADVASSLGVSQMTAMADLSSVEVKWNDTLLLLVRNNFCGTPAFEVHVGADRAAAFWQTLTEPGGKFGATTVGCDAVEVRRIEAGIPAAGAEITDQYLPAETMQSDRAVSFQKGCYLGQEIIERMRTRGQVARSLVRLEPEGNSPPDVGATLVVDDANIGMVTSACMSVALGKPIALGYVKSAASEPGHCVTVVSGSKKASATVLALSSHAESRA